MNMNITSVCTRDQKNRLFYRTDKNDERLEKVENRLVFMHWLSSYEITK